MEEDNDVDAHHNHPSCLANCTGTKKIASFWFTQWWSVVDTFFLRDVAN